MTMLMIKRVQMFKVRKGVLILIIMGIWGIWMTIQGFQIHTESQQSDIHLITMTMMNQDTNSGRSTTTTKTTIRRDPPPLSSLSKKRPFQVTEGMATLKNEKNGTTTITHPPGSSKGRFEHKLSPPVAKTAVATSTSYMPPSDAYLSLQGGLAALNHFRRKQLGVSTSTSTAAGADITNSSHPNHFVSWTSSTTSISSSSTTSTTRPYRPTIGAYRRKYSKVLFFVHIHKSAGTLFCRLAFKNRISINHQFNCNVQEDQYCCGGNDPSIQAQIDFAKETYWDLVATERELYHSMVPEYYDYIIILRDSKSRYYSHYSHLRRVIPIGPGYQVGGFGTSAWLFGNPSSFINNTTESDNNSSVINNNITNPNNSNHLQHHERRELKVGEDPLGNFSTWYEGQPDNWNTRILCGAPCRLRPKYQITKTLFLSTLHRANQFQHFLFVEDFEESYNQFASAYEWHNYTDDSYSYILRHKSNRRKDKDKMIVDDEVTKEPWDPLMSALDDALYEFAQRKYYHSRNQKNNNNHSHDEDDNNDNNETYNATLWAPFQNQEILDRYFQEGITFQCQDACCGNCTSY